LRCGSPAHRRQTSSPTAIKLGLLEEVFEDDQKKDEWRRCVAGTDSNATDTRAKAEGLTVIGSDGNQLRLLVLFDGLLNGSPRDYAVDLPGGG
jgi:hypothetical protein